MILNKLLKTKQKQTISFYSSDKHINYDRGNLMKSCAVLLAAGSSTRMGENKMLIKLLGKNPIERCIDVFSNQVDEIIIAVSENTCKAASEAAKSSCKPV